MIRFLEQYDGFIFDLDGTLADSMHVWDSICRDWLVAKNLMPPADLEETIALMTLEESANFILSYYRLPSTPEQIINAWTAQVKEKYLKTVPLKPGAKQLLIALKQAGKRVALATSCFKEICGAFLAQQGLSSLFDAVVYSDDIGKAKTFPDIYLACSDKIGVTPEKCLVFEDILPALQGVISAGMSFAAVYDSANESEWDLMKGSADLSVLNFNELM